MTAIRNLFIRVYAFLLQLYPKAFRNEFSDEMLLDFSDLARDVSQKGTGPMMSFCLRELVDFPVNLLQAHWREGRMRQVFRSKPINYGLRSALGFGIGFAAITLIGWQISRLLFASFDPMLQTYSIWYWETFQNERWIWLLDTLVQLLSFALTGLFFGLLFAVLAGDHQKRVRYWLAGSLAWFTASVTSSALSNSFGWQFFLSESQMNILGKFDLLLDGMLYSAALIIAEDSRKESLRRLAWMAVLYPLGAYLYIKLLFYLWLEITNWFFPALLILMLILAGSLLVVAVQHNQKTRWIVAAGGIAYPILFYGLVYFTGKFLFIRSVRGLMPGQEIIDLTFRSAVIEAAIGLCFGLLLGLIFGYQIKPVRPQLEGI